MNWLRRLLTPDPGCTSGRGQVGHMSRPTTITRLFFANVRWIGSRAVRTDGRAEIPETRASISGDRNIVVTSSPLSKTSNRRPSGIVAGLIVTAPASISIESRTSSDALRLSRCASNVTAR